MHPKWIVDIHRRGCLLLEQFANQFHPLSVHAEIRMANPRCGAEMDSIRFRLEIEFHIITEAKDSTAKLSSEVVVRLLDNRRPR